MESFDFAGLAIGGVALVWLIPRLVEFAKVLGLSGKPQIWALAFVLGVGFAAVAAAMNEGLLPAEAMPWARVVALALGGGVAACGAIGDYELNRVQRGR